MEKEKVPAKKKAPKSPEQDAGSGVLETVAKAIGTTIGEVAVKTGVVSPPKAHRKKLVAKGKKRLPRKIKKLQKKESQKSSAK